MTLEKQDLQAFRERWKTVAEVEKSELRQMSMAQRWRQFDAILRMAVADVVVLLDTDKLPHLLAKAEQEGLYT